MLDRLEWQRRRRRGLRLGRRGLVRRRLQQGLAREPKASTRTARRTTRASKCSGTAIVEPLVEPARRRAADFGEGPSRDWSPSASQASRPGFFEMEARRLRRRRRAHGAAPDGRLRPAAHAAAGAAARSSSSNVYGKDDPERLIGSGLSDLEVGCACATKSAARFAPYIGVRWSKRFGDSARSGASAAGVDSDEVAWVAGIRAWF